MKERWIVYPLVCVLAAWCISLTTQMHQIRKENAHLRKQHRVFEDYLSRWGGQLATVVRRIREADESGEPVRLPPENEYP